MPFHPRRSEAEIALLSSPTQRSGDSPFVIPDEAKRRSRLCHPRRSEAEIGDGCCTPSLWPPGQPAWAEPGAGQPPHSKKEPVPRTAIRSQRMCCLRPSPGSARAGCPGETREGFSRPRSPLRCVGDDKTPGPKALASRVRRGSGCVVGQTWWREGSRHRRSSMWLHVTLQSQCRGWGDTRTDRRLARSSARHRLRRPEWRQAAIHGDPASPVVTTTNVLARQPKRLASGDFRPHPFARDAFPLANVQRRFLTLANKQPHTEPSA